MAQTKETSRKILVGIELSSTTPPFESTEDFAEYQFGLPSKGSGSAGLNGSSPSIFEYDVKAVLSATVTAGGLMVQF